MLIHSASQLLTLTGGPRRGTRLAELDIISDGAVLLRDGLIEKVGDSTSLLAAYPDEPRLDAAGSAVMPGLVDPHTHLVWAGDRCNEFEMRIQGKTYMEIMNAGGGINATMQATRTASLDELVRQNRPRALNHFYHGVTTVEVKTGYGLDTTSEIKQLAVIEALNQSTPIEMAPTFMGAHAVPPEFNGDTDAFTEMLCNEMIPAVKAWSLENLPALPFVDVFCEENVFNLQHSRRILECARQLGFPLKIHADEFGNIGGAGLAVSLGAASADHLVKISAAEIEQLAKSDTVAVSLPCTPFGLADPHYTPARQIIAAGGILAIASDMNPGPAWCENFQFVLALACRYLKLTPAEAVAAATINAAAAINRADRIGSIEPGKQADLLILSVDDYRHLGYRFGGNLVKTVIKKGEIFPVFSMR
jgi:imidazolonepropionase